MNSTQLNNINIIGKRCCGCEACYAVCPKNAIYTERGSRGELLYKANDACINCGKCLRACSANKAEYHEEAKFFYRAQSKHNEVLKKSSSGGVAFEAARKILSWGGIVYGAVWDIDNQMVQHARLTNLEDLPAMQGSKYVHSSISREIYKRIIFDIKTNKVLFIGTPCQVSAVRNIVGDNDNLFCIDLVCHGVPSAEMLDVQLKKITSSKIAGLSFRRGMQFVLDVKDDRGSIYSKNGYDNPYYAMFLLFTSLRESCYHCKYAQRGRVGDLTIGDYTEDGEGFSCVLPNSEKGRFLISETSSTIDYKERTVEALIENVALNHSTVKNNKVEAFTKRYNRHGLFYAYYRTYPVYIMKRWMRKILGDKLYEKILSSLKKG